MQAKRPLKKSISSAAFLKVDVVAMDIYDNVPIVFFEKTEQSHCIAYLALFPVNRSARSLHLVYERD